MTAGSVFASRIAKWDGFSWAELSRSRTGLNDVVASLTEFDDGSGTALYAGGEFTAAGGVASSSVAKWNGSSWSPMDNGLTALSYPVRVTALSGYDDGSGAALYAGGQFTTMGGQAADYIAKWDGLNWTTLGSGLNGPVNALTIFDDGSGAALYAGGSVTNLSNTETVGYVEKWGGLSWAPLGSGTNGGVFSLAGFDDGSGPALYAGGSFTTAGGEIANFVAKWNGSNWRGLSGGVANPFSPLVFALAAFDDGGGEALYVGGSFQTAGGVVARQIAKWDGSRWSPLHSGMNGRVNALTVSNDGTTLYAGGGFSNASRSNDSYVARWGCVNTTLPVVNR